MTSDERTTAVGLGKKHGKYMTLLVDTDTLTVKRSFEGWNSKIANNDELIFAATNYTKDITIYQVPSSLIVRLDSD